MPVFRLIWQWVDIRWSRFRMAVLAVPPLAVLAIAAASGIGLAQLAGVGMGIWGWITAVVCSACVFVRHRGLVSLSACVGFSYGLLHVISIERIEQIPHYDAMVSGQEFAVTVTGTVADEPRPLGSKIVRFSLRLESVSDHYEESKCAGKILVSLLDAERVPAYGDRLVIAGDLSIPQMPMNPGQFNLREWFFQQGISADFFAAQGGVLQSSPDQGNLCVATALRCRRWIQNQLTRGLEQDPGTASVITAMVLGSRSETPDEIEDAFIGSGTMHIFAVSGLHVGLFGYLAWMFLKAFGLRRSVAIGLIIPGLIFYAFVTGLRPSACRATIMSVIILIGYLCDRVPSLPNSLGAAALVILFGDTLQFLQPGFQLSFVVLGTIVGVAPFIRAPLQKLAEPDPFLPRSLMTVAQRVVLVAGRRAADIFSVSLAAWLGSVFLMLHHFQIAAPIAVLANCFLVPCAFAILFTSSVSLAVGGIAGEWGAVLCNNANWLIAKITVGLAAFFASLPGGGSRLVDDGGLGSMSVTVLHLEQGGGCSHLRVNGGSEWLVDAGHGTDTREVLKPYLQWRGIVELDGMLLTHADAGHVGGAPWLHSLLRPETTIISEQPYRSPTFQSFAGDESTAEFELASAGREFALGSGCIVRILYPPEGATIAIADDQAIVAQIDHLGWRILLMSDAGFATEKWLLDHCRYLDSDVLVKGRHRSDYSGLPEFLSAVSPGAVVSTNASFPKGESIPDQWRAAVEAKGIMLFDQAQTGAVEIKANDDSLVVSGYANGQKKLLRR
ncbi:MAG: ComEC/Rec2 family competence protein [Verrucomicrobiales bacterium]